MNFYYIGEGNGTGLISRLTQIILWLEIAFSVNIKDQYLVRKRTFKSFLMPLRKRDEKHIYGMSQIVKLPVKISLVIMAISLSILKSWATHYSKAHFSIAKNRPF